MPSPAVLTLAQKLPEFEGTIPWMYLDTVGKVTVGTGFMLPDVEAALALPFQASAGTPADPADVRADFLRVAAMAPARGAGFYHQLDGPVLGRDFIAGKTLEILAGVEASVRDLIAGWDALPAFVKPAILDMAYNLGVGKLSREYPRFLAAVAAGQWNICADQCYRRGPSRARNEWTAVQFRLAAHI